MNARAHACSLKFFRIKTDALNQTTSVNIFLFQRATPDIPVIFFHIWTLFHSKYFLFNCFVNIFCWPFQMCTICFFSVPNIHSVHRKLHFIVRFGNVVPSGHLVHKICLMAKNFVWVEKSRNKTFLVRKKIWIKITVWMKT